MKQRTKYDKKYERKYERKNVKWWRNAIVDYWLQSCIPSRQANSFKPQTTLENEIAEAAKIRNYKITQLRPFFSFRQGVLEIYSRKFSPICLIF